MHTYAILVIFIRINAANDNDKDRIITKIIIAIIVIMVIIYNNERKT